MEMVGWIASYIVLSQIGVVPLNAVIQYGDHHILTSVAPLPGSQDVHLWVTVAALIIAVLKINIDGRHQTSPTSCVVKMWVKNDSVYYTYNVPHVGPFRVIEMKKAWVILGLPLYSRFYYLLLGPVHLRQKHHESVLYTHTHTHTHTHMYAYIYKCSCYTLQKCGSKYEIRIC